MTLTAIKKLASQLPMSDRLKLADAMWKSLPPMRESVSLAELEMRADEVESGQVKAVSGSIIDSDLKRMKASLHRQRRPLHRG